MAIRKNKSEGIFNFINAIIMILMIIICIYPLLYVTFASLSEPSKLMQHTGPLLSPLGFTLKGYELVLQNRDIATGYANTIFYVVVGTAVNLIMTSLGAYVLSRKNAYWVNKMMLFIAFTMFFGGGTIPYFLIIKGLGGINHRWTQIIPGAISTWNLIVMRTSFATIPVSLEESAKLDGASDFTILFKIILPLSTPVLAVMALFYGVGHWNSWFGAMLFLRHRSMYPLQLILREILISNSTQSTMVQSGINEGQTDIYALLVQYSTIIVATVQILLIYPFLQKYFVKGVMVGAIKE